MSIVYYFLVFLSSYKKIINIILFSVNVYQTELNGN